MNRVEAAYAAGLFEGEGAVWKQPTNAGTTVAIQMTDLEPLTRMQDIFGGVIRGPYQGIEGHKPIYSWRLNGYESLEFFYEATKEWLSPRRTTQFKSVIDSLPPIEERGKGAYNRNKTHCPQGHTLEDAYRYQLASGTWRRQCRTCQLIRTKAAGKARRKAAREGVDV